MLEMNATNLILFGGAILVLLLIAGGVAAAVADLKKRRRSDLISVAEDGWSATGRVDLSPDDDAVLSFDAEATSTRPCTFVLKAEDVRTISTVSGLDRHETRWRRATLGEAKVVVKLYHDKLKETK